MTWFIQPMEIAEEGKASGKWRMTAFSDEGGGGPFGNLNCFHASLEEAKQCELCDEFVSRASGFPSRKENREALEILEREQLRELKEKYEKDRLTIQVNTTDL